MESTIEKSLKMNQNFLMNSLFWHLEADLFISRSVSDIVSGYYDPLMQLAKETMPDKITTDRFGLMLEVVFVYLSFYSMNILELIEKWYRISRVCYKNRIR